MRKKPLLKRKCLFCKKEFYCHQWEIKRGRKKYCGCKCYWKHRSILSLGKNNPFYGKRHSEEAKRKNAKAHKGKNNVRFGKKHTAKTIQKMKASQDKRYTDIEIRIKYSLAHQGISREEWTHFIDPEPYCQIWTKEFKNFIKERDNYICQNPDCWGTGARLCAHHIDYDKKNCEPWNIITICSSCNIRANHNRKYWQELYESIVIRNRHKPYSKFDESILR